MGIKLNNQRFLRLCLCSGTLLLAACAGKKSGNSPATSKSDGVKIEIFEEADSPSVKIDLDDGDEVLTMAINADGRIALATKNGHAYAVDPETESSEKVVSYFKFDPQVTTALTVSKDYLWVIGHGDSTIGRNKAPPDAAKKVEISKVPVDDLLDTATATPVHASATQLYLAGGDSLAVFTFSGNFINRKKVPFPGEKLAKGEYVLGAGPLGDAGTAAHYWMLTNQRLLRFDGTDWIGKNIIVKGKKKESTLVAMHFGGKGDEVEEAAFGLFGGSVVSALEAVGLEDKTAENYDKTDDKEESEQEDED